MIDVNAASSGQFTLGDITINRLGYGAMRIVGDGVWGPPKDREGCLATLRRLPELGVDFIDTADSYGGQKSVKSLSAMPSTPTTVCSLQPKASSSAKPSLKNSID